VPDSSANQAFNTKQTAASSLPACFTPFAAAMLENIDLPEYFTFPFYYQAHPLCLLAAEQVQAHLVAQQDWYHNFGLGTDPHNVIGKMFGVLLVQSKQGEIGYLAAFSGKLAEQNNLPGFVPPVFDLLAADSFFFSAQQAINALTQEIEIRQKDPILIDLEQQLTQAKSHWQSVIAKHREAMIHNRQARKQQRTTAHPATLWRLNQESINDKLHLKALTQQQTEQVEHLNHQRLQRQQLIDTLRDQRQSQSAALQQKIFQHYRFLNQAGEQRDLLSIFSDTAFATPPAGAGECAAPKLLNYTFAHDLRPLAMAEFWWGASPKSAVRKHRQFYPACLGKCQPILAHMLKGMCVDPNPLLINQARHKNLEIVFQDEHMVIVNKPAELLSVPGKDLTDSVYNRIKQQFPLASGPLIVHRLDMSTSGLMVIALNATAHKNLQRQFIQRRVQKTYIALLDGLLAQEQGEITLPLRGDLFDRPRQLVCKIQGKPAHTTWQVIERDTSVGQTRVRLSPHTGRTHQLRVHCAHVEGLDMPIVGDDLYGTVGTRLHLHAFRLVLLHPDTQQKLEFTAPPEF
jgi:tRNA pseudouridine32 synthase / 23S rRNA pseudouridine746 synthase